jgi:hypothetical protein
MLAAKNEKFKCIKNYQTLPSISESRVSFLFLLQVLPGIFDKLANQVNLKV